MGELFNKFLAWAVCGALAAVFTTVAGAAEYLGPCALTASKDGKTLYVANADASHLACVELPGGQRFTGLAQ